jgi:hypothetical protein
MHRLISDPLCSSRKNLWRVNRGLDRIAAKLRLKIHVMRLIREGRANDLPDSFSQAIALGSYPARAELVLLCINLNLPHAKCVEAFNLVEDGRFFGCPSCIGMLANIYATGFRGIVYRCDNTAYRLACESANAGDWFGKRALVHFLKDLLGVQDPKDEPFYLYWTDLFIASIKGRICAPVPAPASAAKDSVQDVSEDKDPSKGLSGLPADILAKIIQKFWSMKMCNNFYLALPFGLRGELKGVYDAHMEMLNNDVWFEPDWDILTKSDIRNLAEILIEEIQQEHLRNPHMPKVWLNLPSL